MSKEEIIARLLVLLKDAYPYIDDYEWRKKYWLAIDSSQKIDGEK